MTCLMLWGDIEDLAVTGNWTKGSSCIIQTVTEYELQDMGRAESKFLCVHRTL